MKSGKLKNRHAIGCLLIFLVVLSYLFSGCSIKLKDDDKYEAKGTYVFDNSSNPDELFLVVEKSSFPMECGMEEGQIKFSGVDVYADELELPSSTSDTFFLEATLWERSEEGTSGDIVGTWTLTLDTDDDVTLEIEFKKDNSFTLKAWNLSCDDMEDYMPEETIFNDVDGSWALVFKDIADNSETPFDYLLETDDHDTFTLTMTGEGVDPAHDWYKWEGTISDNTYSHYRTTAFDNYKVEGDDSKTYTGTYTSRLSLTLKSNNEIESGSLKEIWDIDDTTITDPDSKSYTISGTKKAE